MTTAEFGAAGPTGPLALGTSVPIAGGRWWAFATNTYTTNG
ncbi:hypothetical protein AB0N09_38950 [Streptomyces erythrochromogenes]